MSPTSLTPVVRSDLPLGLPCGPNVALLEYIAALVNQSQCELPPLRSMADATDVVAWALRVEPGIVYRQLQSPSGASNLPHADSPPRPLNGCRSKDSASTPTSTSASDTEGAAAKPVVQLFLPWRASGSSAATPSVSDSVGAKRKPKLNVARGNVRRSQSFMTILQEAMVKAAAKAEAETVGATEQKNEDDIQDPLKERSSDPDLLNPQRVALTQDDSDPAITPTTFDMPTHGAMDWNGASADGTRPPPPPRSSAGSASLSSPDASVQSSRQKNDERSRRAAPLGTVYSGIEQDDDRCLGGPAQAKTVGDRRSTGIFSSLLGFCRGQSSAGDGPT